MGCFDEVTIRCPACGQTIMEQTKAGDCSMSIYALEDAPAAILDDLVSESPIECPECEYPIRITMIVKPQAIAY